MTPQTHTLAILSSPGLLYALIPVGVLGLGLVTFELAVAITISTLPRSRFQQNWTRYEQRRVLRVFGVVFSAWPISAALILAHVYLPLIFAMTIDALVLILVAFVISWLTRCVRQRNLIMAGHCANCLYDLRASTENDHCPECGAALHDHPAREKPRRSKPASVSRPNR